MMRWERELCEREIGSRWVPLICPVVWKRTTLGLRQQVPEVLENRLAMDHLPPNSLLPFRRPGQSGWPNHPDDKWNNARNAGRDFLVKAHEARCDVKAKPFQS